MTDHILASSMSAIRASHACGDVGAARDEPGCGRGGGLAAGKRWALHHMIVRANVGTALGATAG